jgi:hypothetical protein
MALIFLGTAIAIVRIALYVSPGNRDTAVKAVVAVMAMLIAVVVAWVRIPLTRLKSAPAAIPAMTIGERLKRTNAYYQRIMILVVVAWIVGVVLFPTGVPKMQQQALTHVAASCCF